MEQDFDLDDDALAALDAAEHAYFNGQQPPGPAPPRAPLEALPQNSAFSMVRSGLTQQPVPPPLWQPHPALKRAPNPTGVEANTAPLAAHPDPDAVAANLPPPVPADQAALSEWWYPTNMSVRAYQQSICKTALCHNTLVSIPTGMGKTLIAAVVMFNFHRWFPTGRLAFLAPTKPLIHQQIKAVRKTVGLPRSALAELTGALKPEERAKLWRGPCRLFFPTPPARPLHDPLHALCTTLSTPSALPQTLVNDLEQCLCPAHELVCLVIDEAHKATGQHAYVQAVKMLSERSGGFRVL